MSSKQALCSLLILAELYGKKIGPHGVITSIAVGVGGGFTVTEVLQLPPGQGWSQRVRLVPTFTETVTVPGVAPVVSSVTSDPVVDERVPPVVDHVKVALSAPLAVALSVTRSPTVTEADDARTSQVTVGHGGSVTSKLVVHVVWPVVTQSLGQSTAGTDAVTVVVTE
mgnify:CR=1 FL=1